MYCHDLKIVWTNVFRSCGSLNGTLMVFVDMLRALLVSRATLSLTSFNASVIEHKVLLLPYRLLQELL
jgi:hypothetical protein